jgi:signal transduction histidine kinase
MSASRPLALKDAGLAVVLAAFVAFATPHAARGEIAPRTMDKFGVALAAVAGLLLVARRWLPYAVAGAVTAVVATYLAMGYAFGPILLLLFIAIYTVAAERPPRESLVAAVVCVTAVVIASLPREGPYLLWVGWYVGPWSLGALVRGRRESVRRQREEATARAAYEERLRIAQEVHDVVGHGLSVIAMQAGVALHVLDRRPDRARESLEAIRATSRESLDGLRATLAVFRGDGDQRRPVAGLDELPRLVDGVRAAGIPVDLVVNGEPREVPSSVSHAAYRIVQESLTNVVRHAGPTRAQVGLDYADGALMVTVRDDGPGPVGPVDAGEGITGMRERARAVGGSLNTSAPPEGGFLVEARLPYAAVGAQP